MSPLLFLAIAIVVPLLGMIVLGVGARIKSKKATDDDTGLFRRQLESIAPPASPEPPSGTPGLVGTMRRRRRGGSSRKEAPGNAAAASGDAEPAARPGPHSPARTPLAPAPASVRLVERQYTVPLLLPLSSDLEEPPQLPEPGQRNRQAMPRPPQAQRRHDRVNSANQGPNRGRSPGS